MASMPSGNTGSRSVRACTECKQAKLRCDSKDSFPNPCSRCRKKELFCTVDTSFQRTPARKRLEAMSRELQDLRNQRGDHSITRSESLSAASKREVEESHDDLGFSREFASLNGTLVEASLVVSAFKEFAQNFSHQLPIRGSLSINQMYEKESFLFWTIIVIVSSHLPEHPYNELYAHIGEPYQGLTKEEIFEAPLPLHKIQALLYLSTWALPVVTQPKDPSWLYCGMAIHAARYMGLDREQNVPSLRSLGVYSGASHARMMTWLGCFYVGTTLSMHLGLRPPIDNDLDFITIHAFLARKTVPSDFETLTRVQLVVAKFITLLIHNISDAARTSMMRLVDAELDVLKAGVSESDRGYHKMEFSILVVKLHFYAMLITKSQGAGPASDIMLKSGLATALRIAYISALRTHDDQDNSSITRKQRSLPKNYYRGLAFTAIFLLIFFHLNSEANQEEQQSAATHIAFAHGVFEACSTDPLDEYDRTAKVLEILARLTPGTLDPRRLRFTHRMGVSILLDAVSTAGEVRGMPVDITTGETVEEATGRVEDGNEWDPPASDMPHILDQMSSSADFLRELWDDPIMNMLNYESGFSVPDLGGFQ